MEVRILSPRHSHPDHSHMLLRKQRFLGQCRLAQEPGVFVWGGMDYFRPETVAAIDAVIEGKEATPALLMAS